MPVITPAEYELAVLERIRLEFRSSGVRVCGTEGPVKHLVRGRYSLVDRQLDVAAYRLSASTPFFVADAKCHANKLDVKDVETFVGMVEDIGAEIALLVAPQGFTPAAERRACAASMRVFIMTIEQALTFRWLPIARQIFPQDWVFHEQLAICLRRLNEHALPEHIIEPMESLAFEEAEAFIRHALATDPAHAVDFLTVIATRYHDDSWRYNAVRLLAEAQRLTPKMRADFLAVESDPETIALLREEI